MTASLLAALGAGLMAGIFFIFSNTIMRSLAKLPPTDGMIAMRSLNVTIVNPLFLLIFMGTGVVCLALLIISLVNWHAPGSVLVLVGAIAYLLGSIVVTIAFNVPMNDALAAAQIGDPASLSLWQDYLSRWTMWNHVRTVCCIVSTACLITALWVGRR